MSVFQMVVGAGFPRPWLLGGETPPLQFLAAHDDSGKLVGGIVFVAIWLLSTIASSIKKKNEEARRRQILTQPRPEPLPTATVSGSAQAHYRLYVAP